MLSVWSTPLSGGASTPSATSAAIATAPRSQKSHRAPSASPTRCRTAEDSEFWYVDQRRRANVTTRNQKTKASWPFGKLRTLVDRAAPAGATASSGWRRRITPHTSQVTSSQKRTQSTKSRKLALSAARPLTKARHQVTIRAPPPGGPAALAVAAE